MNKYYDLRAVINGESHSYSKHFPTREAAINFAFNRYEDNYQFGMVLEDEYECHGNKHEVEYVINYNNRFVVTRVCA